MGANANSTLLKGAEEGNIINVVQSLNSGASIDFKNDRGHAALQMASKRGHHDIAELLLARGADPEEGDAKNCTALHYAAMNGHHMVCQKFVDKKVKLRIIDDDGMTPLHYAAKNNHVEACLVLIDGGAPVDVKENKGGYTPLHLAAAKGRHKVIVLLLDKGASIHAQDNEGNTPLHKAAANNQPKACAVLVQNSANALLTNKFGKIPYVLTENDAIRDILPNPDNADRASQVMNERKAESQMRRLLRASTESVGSNASDSSKSPGSGFARMLSGIAGSGRNLNLSGNSNGKASLSSLKMIQSGKVYIENDSGVTNSDVGNNIDESKKGDTVGGVSLGGLDRAISGRFFASNVIATLDGGEGTTATDAALIAANAQRLSGEEDDRRALQVVMLTTTA